MTNADAYTRERVQKLAKAHQTICERRGISPTSAEGLYLVDRMLDEFDGSEDVEIIIRRFSN